MKAKQKWVVGIDEAGRGPLAGPVTVGLVKVSVDFDWELIPGVNDSKKLTDKKRLEIFKQTKELKREKKLDFAVVSVSAKEIDKTGISNCIKKAISSGIKKLTLDPKEVFVKLDGSLKAPEEFAQETIIKGDSKEKVIGLASVMAKVTRDLYMERISTKYPEYDLAKHKGYGTKFHREMIAKNGLSTEHRVSYCKNINLL